MTRLYGLTTSDRVKVAPITHNFGINSPYVTVVIIVFGFCYYHLRVTALKLHCVCRSLNTTTFGVKALEEQECRRAVRKGLLIFEIL